MVSRAIITSVKAAVKPIPIVTGQDSEVESVKSIMAGEQYSTINKDTRALVAETKKDSREVIALGESGILETAPPWMKPKYEISKGLITWPNGCQGFLYSGEEPDQLRGPQFHKAWVDEWATWLHDAARASYLELPMGQPT